MDDKTQNAFKELAEALEKGGASPYTFMKRGDNLIRLVLEDGRSPTQFFEYAENYYNGKVTKKWVVLALVHTQEKVQASPEEFYKVKPVVLPTKVRDSIVNNAARGFELFDPKEGYALTIVKAGEGIGTSYEVVMSTKPVPIDPSKIVWPDKTLKQLADEHTEFNRGRSTGGTGHGAPASSEEESLGEPSGW